jgi:hypothetical protein
MNATPFFIKLNSKYWQEVKLKKWEVSLQSIFLGWVDGACMYPFGSTPFFRVLNPVFHYFTKDHHQNG